MNPYTAFLRTRFKSRIQYRTAAFAGVVTQFFWGFIRIMVLEAFYRSAPSLDAPMSFEEAVAYVWLGQAFLALLPWNLDQDVVVQIRDGTVAYELLRPVHLYSLWYVRAVAWRVAGALLRCIPLLLFAYFVLPLVGLEEWRLLPPPSLQSGIAFAVSLAFAILTGCAITTIGHATLMWTVAAQGVMTLIPTLTTIGSGMIIPLPLFPDWTQTLFRILPFHTVADTPFRIYSGNIAGIEAISVIGQQILWAVVLVAFGRWLVGRGLKRLVVQGG